MAWWRHVASRWRGTVRDCQAEAADKELARELASHRDLLEDDLVRRGADRDEAHFTACRALGNTSLIRETVHTMRTWRSFDRIRRDAAHAVRTLRRNPGFAVSAILTMALGIGASVAMFGVLNTVLLRPLPYREPGRIVFVWETKQQFPKERVTVAPANYRDWKSSNHVFADMALVQGTRFHLSGAGEPKKVRGLGVSTNFFDLLGSRPAIGRTFFPGEMKHVLVLSNAFWRGPLHSDRGAIGKTLALDEQAYTIIGVMKPDFYFPDFGEEWEMWTPLAPEAAGSNDRDAHSAGAIGRVRPGVELAQAQREMNGIAARLSREFTATNRGAGVSLLPIAKQADASVRQSLLAMLGAVCLLLLIACSNVAILLLVRSTARRREMALRMAVGAERHDVLSQLLTESMVLAALGGSMGVVSAAALFPVLRALPLQIPRIGQIAMDWRVVCLQ